MICCIKELLFKDNMISLLKKIYFFLLLTSLLIVFSCKKDQPLLNTDTALQQIINIDYQTTSLIITSFFILRV